MSLQRIKELRPDVTDYVLHSTRNEGWERNRDSAFDRLKNILCWGFIRATFGEKVHTVSRTSVKTVVGKYPAVSFTEQPLSCFIKSIEADHRYTEFAIAVRKDELFAYGGRPVIYGTRDDLKELNLPEDRKYLWATYNPLENIDWTHEREWRVRPNEPENKRIGLYSDLPAQWVETHNFPLLHRVPIFLPYLSFPSITKFMILVDTEQRKSELTKWIGDNQGKISEKGDYWRSYATALNSVQILSFEKVKQNAMGRIEDFLKML